MKVGVKVSFSVPLRPGDTYNTPIGVVTVTPELVAMQNGSPFFRKEVVSQHEIDVPDDATNDQIQQIANQLAAQADTAVQPPAPVK